MLYPNGEISLGLSTPVKSHNSQPKARETRERKGQSFTPYGRRMVRNAAWWLEQQHGRQQLSFLTCTLPDRAIELMAQAGQTSGHWSEILRQFEQWLKRRLQAVGLCDFIVGVSEVQERRWVRYKKVGLHLHWVFQGRISDKSDWAISKEEFLEAWLRIVSAVVGEKIESKSATRVERVKKSVENYLAKYMSKGGKIIQSIIEAGQREQLPSSWWNVSNGLRRIIKSMMVRISDEAKNCLYDTREYLKEQGILQWFHVIYREMRQSHGELVNVPVAFVGKFRKPAFKEQFNY